LPISRETRRGHRRQANALPRVVRLLGPQLRRLKARVHAMHRARVPTVDGRRTFNAITLKRCSIINWIIDAVGWKGRARLALAVIAAATDSTVDTVLKALADAEAMGVLKRHPQWEPANGGPPRRAGSFFELLAPPEPEPQGALGSSTYVTSLTFLAKKRAQQVVATGRKVATMAAATLFRESKATSLSDREAFENRDRQLRLLLGGA
jgi:hypothetical protein